MDRYIRPIFFVDIFTYKQFAKFHGMFTWYVLQEGIYEYKDIINSCDLIILDVAEINLMNYVNFDFSAKVVLRIHNINYWLSKERIPLTNIFNYMYQKILAFNKDNFRKLISALVPRKLRLEYVIMKQLLRRVDYISFCDDTLYDYAKERNFSYNYLRFPVSYYIRKKITYPYKKVKVVIPGQVSADRRDYNLIMDSFSCIEPYYAKKIECTLLGDASTDESKNIIRLLRSSNVDIKIQIFKKFIDQDEYVKIMLQSHIVLNPVKLNTWYRGEQEYYSFSKTSGAYGDVMRYGLIPLFPRDYKVSARFEGYFERFINHKDLATKLESYTDFTFLSKQLTKMHTMLENENRLNSDQLLKSMNLLTR